MKNIEKLIKDAISAKKYKIGTRAVTNSIKGSKLIIISKSLSEKFESKIIEEANQLGIPILRYAGNSMKLGRLCNKQFRISTISLKIGDENEIKGIVENSK